MTENNSVERNDHIKYVATQENAPQIPEDIQSSQLYQEEFENTMDWTESNYNPETLQNITDGLNQRTGLQLDNWTVSLDSIPTGPTTIDPELTITANCTYELDIPGYGTADTTVELSIAYDEQNQQAQIDAAVEGAMDYDFPDHFSQEDKKRMQEDVSQELNIFRQDLEHVLDENLPDGNLDWE